MTKVPGEKDCPRMLLGDGFCGEKAVPLSCILVLSVAFSAKLTTGHKDPHECPSELARWGEAEDHTI